MAVGKCCVVDIVDGNIVDLVVGGNVVVLVLVCIVVVGMVGVLNIVVCNVIVDILFIVVNIICPAGTVETGFFDKTVIGVAETVLFFIVVSEIVVGSILGFVGFDVVRLSDVIFLSLVVVFFPTGDV